MPGKGKIMRSRAMRVRKSAVGKDPANPRMYHEAESQRPTRAAHRGSPAQKNIET